MLPYVLTTWSGEKGAISALVVEDAVYCGSCRPHPAPVRLDLVLQEKDS
jgi:hypothetical protein